VTASQDRILQLAEKIRRYRAEGVDKGLSEQDTKAVFVEPLLEAIGWAVRDPMQVSREDRPTVRPVDYSLKIGGKPAVMLECKRLANRLDNQADLEQALSYASSAGVRWCVLTNGCLFRIYNSLAPEVAEKKLLEEVDLSSVGEAGGLALDTALQRLDLISPQSIESGHIDQVWEERYTGTKIRDVVKELWGKPDPGLVNLVRQRMKERGRTLTRKDTSRWLQSLDVQVATGTMPVPKVKPKSKPKQAPPSPTRIKIGSYRDQIRYSYEILIKTAEWLIKQGKLTASDCPIPTGRRRNLVNVEAKHRDGEQFTAPRRLSNSLWLETHFSTEGCIRSARRLLERFGYSGGILQVE
jgi:hypothetical protein